MRVLAIHNYYQQRGGEDQCFEDEVSVLQAQGHEVRSLTVHNDSIEGRSKLRVARQSIWNSTAYDQVFTLTQEYKPDIVHVMNAFPLFSPSIFYAAKKSGTTVVHEVQNYRMFCANALLMRNGKHCEDCIGKRFALPAIVHRCYRNSSLGSATLAISSALHRRWQTWDHAVDLFICPSVIARKILIHAGLPEQRVRVKPNALNFDPGMGSGSSDAFVFVGRLSPEKGLKTLFAAWQADSTLPSLKIIGDGPDSSLVQQFTANDSRVEWLGRQPLEKLLEVVGEAQALIMPSLWNETFGRTTIEAFSKGTPVIGSRIGGTAELIDEGQTGWLFEPGSASELLSRIRLSMRLDVQQKSLMRAAARRKFLENYLPLNNYQELIQCYEHAQRISLQNSQV
jgi:glycosyltransferase involved in cell wall biosynthesis